MQLHDYRNMKSIEGSEQRMFMSSSPKLSHPNRLVKALVMKSDESDVLLRFLWPSVACLAASARSDRLSSC